MTFSDFLYVLKRVLSSPLVIGIIIAALLYLKLVFYILNYSKRSGVGLKRLRQGPKNQEKASSTDEVNSEDDTQESA